MDVDTIRFVRANSIGTGDNIDYVLDVPDTFFNGIHRRGFEIKGLEPDVLRNLIAFIWTFEPQMMQIYLQH